MHSYNNKIFNASIFIDEDNNIVVNDNFIEISLIDNGTGIKGDIIRKLFQIDQNISTRGTQNERDSGVGLILCKEFAYMNNIGIFGNSEFGTESVSVLHYKEL